MLRLRTLGGLSIENAPARGAATQRRPLALLAVLARAEPAGVSRDRILALFWPDADTASARNSLKQLVYSLRHDLEAPDLVTGTSELRLNAARIRCDLWEFAAGVAAGDDERALAAYGGPFLDGIYLTNAPEFERWVEDQRVAVAHQFASVAERLATRLTADGKAVDAVGVWRRLSSLDPLNGRIAIALMESLAASGDRAGALTYARTYESLLAAELGVAPGPDVQRVVDAIRAEPASPSAAAVVRRARIGAAPSTGAPSPAHGAPLPIDASQPPARGARPPHGRRRWFVPTTIGLAALALAAFSPTIARPLERWNANRHGRDAMARWDVVRAQEAFRRASRGDSTDAHAYLALAELGSWMPFEPWAREEQARSADMALRFGARLSPWERMRALALRAAADGRLPEACRAFDALIAHDSTDFAAWYGRAECTARDSVVVPDSASPSGWRFRTSYHAAIRAYVRAFTLRPDFHRAFAGQAISHLSRVLMLQPSRVRFGMSDGDRAEAFGSFPAWQGDSLAFVPYPMAQLQRGAAGSIPPTTLAAVAHNRETLRALTALWATAAPSADAYEAQASVLELLGELDVSRGGETAINALATARRLATLPDQQLRLAVADVRFSVKRSHFAEARRLADSLLSASREPTPHAAMWLAPMAAVTDRPALAAHLAEVSAAVMPSPLRGRPLPEPPLPVLEAWLSSLAFASAGAADSALASYRRLERVLHLVEPASYSQVRTALLQQSVRFAWTWYPDSALAVVDTLADPLAQMVLQLRRGDLGAARRRYAVLEAARANSRLADRWPDAVLVESRILIAVGDTARAAAMIDAYLDAFAVLTPGALDRVETAASVPQLMRLRAIVARARGERATAERWERALREMTGR